MTELVIYALALGVVATLFVPLLFGFTKGFIPASIQPNIAIPTAYPTGGAAILWSVVFWGIFLGLGLWLVSMVKPVGEAVRREA